MKNLLPLIKSGLLFIFLAAGLNAYGQNPCPINCSSSADFFVFDLYLGYANGQSLPADYNCAPGTTTPLTIWAVFGGSTSAGRYSLKLYYEVKVDGVLTGSYDVCKYNKLPIPTGVPVELGVINWKCGDEIILDNYYMSWQTAQNKNCGCNNKCFSPGVPLIVRTPLYGDFESTSACNTGDLFNTITYTDKSTGGAKPYTYLWNFGSGATTPTGTLATQAVSYTSGGNKTVTLTVTDDAGIIRTVTNTVTVSGCCNLAITCVGNQSKNTDSGKGYYTVVGTEFHPTVSDANCGPVTLTNNKNGTSSLAGATFNIGTHTVTWTATNGTHTKTCSFTVTVADNQNPTITCPTVNSSYNTTAGQCHASLSFTATASDNSGVAPTVTYSVGATPITFPHNFPVGTTTVMAKATDGSGNTATCSFSVVVVDSQNPIINCPTLAASYNADAGKCHASLSLSVTANDACGIKHIKYYIGSTEISFPYNFPVGTTALKAVATDNNNRTSECVRNVVVIDNQNPVPVCFTPESSYPTDTGEDYATVTFSATATDNCGVASIKYYVGTTEITSTKEFPLGVTTVRVVATDVNGRTGECIIAINVSDEQGPVITCPSVAAPYQTDADKCYKSLTFTATAVDNNDPNPTITYKIGSSTITFPYNFPVGTTTVTVVAKDTDNNSNSCTFDVKVEDKIKPVISCIPHPEPIILLPMYAYYTVNGTEFDPTTFSDNCSATVKNSVNNTSTLAGAQLAPGVHNIVWMATDPSGNSNTCSFTVTIFEGDCIEIGACYKTYVVELYPIKYRTTTVYRGYLNEAEIIQTINSRCLEPINELQITFSKTVFTPQDWGDGNQVTISVKDRTGQTVSCNFTVIVRYPLKSGDMFASGFGSPEFENTELELTVYPNPTTGRFYVELWNLNNPRVTAVIYNTTGAVIMHKEITTQGQIDLDLTGNVSGLYLLRLVADHKEFLRKIVLDTR